MFEYFELKIWIFNWKKMKYVSIKIILDIDLALVYPMATGICDAVSFDVFSVAYHNHEEYIINFFVVIGCTSCMLF